MSEYVDPKGEPITADREEKEGAFAPPPLALNPTQVVPAVTVTPAHLQYGTDQFNRPLSAPRATTDNEERDRLAKERARITEENAKIDQERAAGQMSVDAAVARRATLVPAPPPLVTDKKDEEPPAEETPLPEQEEVSSPPPEETPAVEEKPAPKAKAK